MFIGVLRMQRPFAVAAAELCPYTTSRSASYFARHECDAGPMRRRTNFAVQSEALRRIVALSNGCRHACFFL